VVWLLCSKIFDKEVCASKTWYLPTRLHSITSQRKVYGHHCENFKFHNSSCRLWKLLQVYLIVIYEVHLKYKVLVERQLTLPIRLGVYKCHYLTAPFLGLLFLEWSASWSKYQNFEVLSLQTKSITLLHL